MAIWVYKQDRDGRVGKLLVAGDGKRHLRGEEPPDDHLSKTILRAYYRRECEQGSRFWSGYSKDKIKRVHDTALARWHELGQEY
jgi:hypothetical protein